MEVTKLVVNNINISLIDKPIGLDTRKVSLNRDFQYSCIDTEIDIELKFYCASGKNAIDLEFETKGIEGNGYVEITDSCGINAKIYTFNLDYKKYNNQGDYTTIGLIDVNSLWKQDLNKEANLTQVSGLEEDFYVRNLPLNYRYDSQKLIHEEIGIVGVDYIYDYDIPLSGTTTDFFLSLYPKTQTTLNELEKGNELLAETLIIGNNFLGQYIQLDNIDYYDSSGALATRPASFYRVPDYEPTPIFENELDDGEFTISVVGDIGVDIHFDKNYDLEFDIGYLQEIVLVGSKWGVFSKNNLLPANPLCGYIKDTGPAVPAVTIIQSNPIPNAPLPYTLNQSASGTHSITATFPVKKGEKVWIINQFHLGVNAPNNFKFKTNTIRYELNHQYNIDFKLTKNTTNLLTSSSDIEPYHTKTTAVNGYYALNEIFGTQNNLCSLTDCFSDLWFSRGDLLRQKINKADFIVKPSDFFRELEKVVCCGLGYFYDTATPEKRLMPIFDFYTDNLVPSKYQFDYNDLIEGKIELAPFISPYYNEIEIGYTNFKDSPRDLCKQNKYSIDNISDSTYSKVSDIIASQYIITRALRLGSEDKELEYDKNIFLLSGTTDSGYNVTISQTSGYLADNIFVNPNYAGINRRYATALNLFRHLYKWGFSLFADKDKLKVAKYEGNNIYNYEIRDTSSPMPSSPIGVNPKMEVSYHKLSKCYLPFYNYVKVDRTVEDIYDDFIQSGLYVPTQIIFKTGNLSTLDLMDMRTHQYDLFSVTDGINTYYGNLISANLEDDITEIKLLRRFKNGI